MLIIPKVLHLRPVFNGSLSALQQIRLYLSCPAGLRFFIVYANQRERSGK